MLYFLLLTINVFVPKCHIRVGHVADLISESVHVRQDWATMREFAVDCRTEPALKYALTMRFLILQFDKFCQKGFSMFLLR